MISANNVSLRLGKKALFEDVNIKFTEGNCYGLIDNAHIYGRALTADEIADEQRTPDGDTLLWLDFDEYTEKEKYNRMKSKQNTRKMAREYEER